MHMHVTQIQLVTTRHVYHYSHRMSIRTKLLEGVRRKDLHVERCMYMYVTQIRLVTTRYVYRYSHRMSIRTKLLEGVRDQLQVSRVEVQFVHGFYNLV